MSLWVVGVAGGSGSGKSTLVRMLAARMARVDPAVLPHDAYYRSNPHLSRARRRQINYDHPDSLETSLLVRQLEALRRGRSIQRPVYDFSSHLRSSATIRVAACRLLIVEGILVLADAELRAQMDLKIFVYAPEATRFARRLKRDIQERGRTEESVRQQHKETVQPMYRRFVEPSRSFADLEIDGEGELEPAVDALVTRLRSTDLNRETAASG